MGNKINMNFKNMEVFLANEIILNESDFKLSLQIA